LYGYLILIKPMTNSEVLTLPDEKDSLRLPSHPMC